MRRSKRSITTIAKRKRSVYLGAANTHARLQRATFELADIAGMPTARDFNSGGEALKAFVWYLPSGESIEDEDLDPELRDALKALGYIE